MWYTQAEAKGLDEENSSLRAQVTQLKQELVTMEIRNGGTILNHCHIYSILMALL